MESNESNAVCLFLNELISAASGDDALAEAIIHDTLQEKVEDERLVRVGDVSNGLPKIKANGEVSSFNVFLTVQFLVKASPDSREKRVWGRDTASKMAKAFAKAIFENPQMRTADGAARVCGVSIEREQAGWAKPSSTRYAVHYYLLKFNNL